MRAACRILLTAVAVLLAVRARSDEILISAAASLTDSFSEIGRAYTAANPHTIVRFNFAASGPLQQQILQGAPVDVFASASPKEMDALQRANRIVAGTRVDFAANRLVLIAPAGSRLRSWNDLRSPAVRRVAVSNPDSVPAGRHARETLIRRELWSAVQPKAVFGENVRQTLAYVSGGNADAGIVFATDSRIEARRVRIVATDDPGGDHTPIVYPAAVVSGAPNAAGARSFVHFLQGREAKSILARYGFAQPASSLRADRRAPKPRPRPAS